MAEVLVIVVALLLLEVALLVLMIPTRDDFAELRGDLMEQQTDSSNLRKELYDVAGRLEVTAVSLAQLKTDSTSFTARAEDWHNLLAQRQQAIDGRVDALEEAILGHPKSNGGAVTSGDNGPTF